MGRWMEIVREQPPEGQRYHDGVYQQLVAGEAAPYPLMHASRRVCQANPGQREVVRKEFPTLEKVRVDSPQYVDEDLWLTSQEAGRLLEELRRLRRVCRWEEFIHGLDGQATYEQWREG